MTESEPSDDLTEKGVSSLTKIVLEALKEAPQGVKGLIAFSGVLGIILLPFAAYFFAADKPQYAFWLV